MAKYKYALLLVIFAALFFQVLTNLNDLRHAIDSRLASSAHLEDASRYYVELQSFHMNAHRFVEGDANVNHTDVSLAFDLFWARTESLSASADDDILLALDEKPNLFDIAKSGLRASDPLVANLMPGDLEALAKIETIFAAVNPRVEKFAQAAYHKRVARSVEIADIQRSSSNQLNRLQIAFLLFGLISPFLLMTEVLHHQKFNEQIKEREQQIMHAGLVDLLTGLNNRRFLVEYLATVHQQGAVGNLALMVLDLDGIKSVNDTYGHPVGDRLLKIVAERLTAIAPAGTIITRLDGDEFALASQEEASNVTRLASRIIEELGRSFVIDNRNVTISAGIGMAFSTPESSITAEDILGDAYVALQEAKNAGRGSIRLYDLEQRRRQSYRHIIEDCLSDAIDNAEISVCYHPQIDLKMMTVVGVEALCRWHHPVLGIIPPEQFIKVAEQTGLIRKLDFFVLETACREINVLARAGMDLRLALNVSPIEAGRRGYARELLDAIDRVKFPRNRLKLELTENAMMEDFSVVERNLKTLVDAGVEIALDDFGAGYSNLSYLVRFPFSYLKLDRYLANNIATSSKDRTVLEGIVKLAEGLDLRVIMEGIETQDQLDFIQSIGVAEAQGFLFAEPLSDVRLIPFLATFAMRHNQEFEREAVAAG